MPNPYIPLYFAMVTIISWMFNLLIQLLTIFRPRTRKLWCAVPDKLGQPFSIDCVADKDDILTLKKKIWDHAPDYFRQNANHHGALSLYSPVVQLNYEEEFDVRNGASLGPRRMITSNPLFPESKDQDVDIVVVNRNASPSKQELARPPRSKIHIFHNCLRVVTNTHTITRNR